MMKMRFSSVLALLCFTKWMVHTTHGRPQNCCIQWSNTKVPLKRIVSYTIQSEGVCGIKVVLLHTKQRRTLCSDPNSQLAQDAILKVDKERNMKALQEQGQNEKGTTSNITPSATTSDNAAQKKGRDGRRKKSRRGKKRLRKRV